MTDQERYERELDAEVALLKANLWKAKLDFDKFHMKDLSLKAKADKRPQWERLNVRMFQAAHRLTLIEQYRERATGGMKLPLNK